MTQLSIIMPCFNEMSTIAKVVGDWQAECKRLGIDYEFRVYDAASTDGTVETLRQLATTDPGLKVIVEPKLPHGASCVRGYNEAQGEWVFQMDSDDEMGTESFESLWRVRDQYDLLLGVRQDRVSPLPRRVVTLGAKLSLALLFGGSIRDANSPYRLMRRTKLAEIMPSIPADTLAPNVIVSGLMRRRKARIYQIDVPHRSRAVGTAAGLNRWKLVRTASRCFKQTLSAAIRG